jgi:bifunctional ADP-heptose synthase (sugar kinase/adenylyltransferase)
MLDRLRNLKVLVVGEAIIDEYQYCTALGKSAKDPILAVQKLRSTSYAGGVLAVANHLAAFCDAPTVLTQLGDRDSMEEFIRQNLRPEIHPVFLQRRNAPTIVKQRIIEEYSFTKLLSIYDWNNEPLTAADDGELCETLDKIAANFDLVLVIDYGHSMMTPDAVDILTRKARFLAVNAQSNAGNLGFQSVSKYPRADLSCIASAELLHEMRNRTGDCEKLLYDLRKRLGYERVIVTLGKKGCAALDKDDETLWTAPALAARIADRMGGGDAFLSLAAPCLAAGLPMEVACFLGSVAAGHAVGTVGHERSIERAGFHKAIEALLK